MKKQSIVSAFSYPARKAALIEEVADKAAREGQSLSNLIVSLLEEYNQKNQEASIDLSALKSATTLTIEKHQEINNTLDIWINSELINMHIQKLLEIKPKAARLMGIITQREHDERIINWRK